ncbi:MAG: cellulase family glycosylhydrolase [Clostridia bacterium]|nr:cellulase family glycosylhydrolase [Clostridia bacterium]
MVELKIKPSEVRGFNYHPSYSYGSLEDWLLFDEEVWRRELANGKKHFPKMNTIRIWLSWNAFCRLEGRFIEHIKKVIEICKELDLYVIPSLFNRWHDPMVNCDSIYIDHFLPNSSWLHKFGNLFEDYIDALCDAFGKEERILVWDICNEPCAYNGDFPLKEEVKAYELAWLKKMADRMRANKVTQPLGIGSTGKEPMETFGDVCDVYLTHLYYQGGDIEKFEQKFLRFFEEAKKNDKPLIISECCWGSFDDKYRSELIRVALSIFTKYGIGFVAHALQYCGCADLHDAADGRSTPNIGNLCFVNKDGALRPYHEIYNEF